MMTTSPRAGEGRAIAGNRRTTGRRVVSVTAVDRVETGEIPDMPAGESFVGPIVARLAAQHGLDPQAVGSLAVQVLASFEGARVRAFVPILLEKRLRETCRGAGGLGTMLPADGESTAVVG
jgi:hypothetical protein